MSNLRKHLKGEVDVDVDALYDRLGGVPHRETIEVEVGRAVEGARGDLIGQVVEQFDIRNRKKAEQA